MTAQIVKLSAEEAYHYMADLMELLRDAVDTGASVGFLPPLSALDSENFWHDIIKDIQAGTRIMLAALVDGRVAGAVQLGLAQKPNSVHRAEVQKLLVHNQYRRRGIGRALMFAIEEEAKQHHRKLLVLDTIKGDVAEQLYPTLGYIRVGEIPQFAIIADRSLEATVVFYKILD